MSLCVAKIYFLTWPSISKHILIRSIWTDVFIYSKNWLNYNLNRILITFSCKWSRVKSSATRPRIKTAVFVHILLVLQMKIWCCWTVQSHQRDGTIRAAYKRASKGSFNAHSADRKDLTIYWLHIRSRELLDEICTFEYM